MKLALHTKISRNRNARKGFTLVEVLVTVIVIAILAGAIVLGYSNIQNRAITSQYATVANQWHKALELQYSFGGSFPVTTEVQANGETQVCLGKSASDYPATGNLAAGECSTNNIPFDQDFVDQMLPDVLGDAPDTILPETQITYLDGEGSGFYVRGIAYNGVSPDQAQLIWAPPTKGVCASGDEDEATAATWSGEYCILDLDHSP